MKRRMFALFLLLSLCLLCVLPAFAAEASLSGPSGRPLVVDNAGLLTAQEVQKLTSRLEEISARQAMDVAVVTTLSLDGKTERDYADDFYDENEIGQGENKDGILLLISESERVWAISTSGSCIDAFTDSDLDYIAGNLLPYLSDGDWSGAAISFADDCGPCLSAYEPDDGNYSDDTDDDYDYTPSVMYFNSVWLIGSLLVGLIVALIVTLSMKRGMKSVSMKSSAADYLRSGSFTPGRSEDLFLYHTVSVTAKPKDDDNDRGGFSSTHVSSGGSTHGGRSGSF